MKIAALIVAAGRGARAAASGGPPKQYAALGGSTVLAQTITAFANRSDIDVIQAVIHPGDSDLYNAAVARLSCPALAPPAAGGATRQESVRLGLAALGLHTPDIVLVHDAARPFVTSDVIDRVIDACRRHRGAIAAVPLADTLKRQDEQGLIGGTVDRRGLWRAQTPQGFEYATLASAHEKARLAARDDFTDDAALAEWAGIDVALVQGSERNVKLTTAEDLGMANRMMAAEAGAWPEVRTGQGFDVHRFAPGASVWLCGLEIPHSARLEGHSDADVALHALTDAILGAIGAGDIGLHFPPSDQRWKDAASHIFLAHAAKLMAERGGRLTNVDITILAEAPRISPHRAAMCERVAAILGIEAARVSVKATTTEGLGFTGRREGIAAMAVATVVLDGHRQ